MNAAAADPAKDGFLSQHPKALWILFFSELWERFSFYGMRALLVLYMVSESLRYTGEEAYGFYAAYTSIVYASPILGGWLADKILGFKNAIVLGGTLMAAGHFAMAWEHETVFFAALGLIALGNGFFKPNISSTVGRLYPDGDPMRDRGFYIFYMGINVGALIAPLFCGWLGETYGWHWGFTVAGVGMLVGQAVFLAGQKLLDGKGDPSNPELCRKWLVPIWIAAFIGSALVALLISQPVIAKYLLFSVASVILVMIVGIALKQERVGRDRIFLFLVLFVFHAGFWALFEQAGSSLTLFARDCTERSLSETFVFPVTWTQAFNPLFIILLAPLFTIVWAWTRKRDMNPSIPRKFALGTIFVGLGYLLLASGGGLMSDVGLVPLYLLVGLYFIHTMGELCLSPVGLSAVTKLAPKANAGLFMGAWFLSISLGLSAAGVIASATDDSAQFNLSLSYVSATDDIQFGGSAPEGLSLTALQERSEDVRERIETINEGLKESNEALEESKRAPLLDIPTTKQDWAALKTELGALEGAAKQARLTELWGQVQQNVGVLNGHRRATLTFPQMSRTELQRMDEEVVRLLTEADQEVSIKHRIDWTKEEDSLAALESKAPTDFSKRMDVLHERFAEKVKQYAAIASASDKPDQQLLALVNGTLSERTTALEIEVTADAEPTAQAAAKAVELRKARVAGYTDVYYLGGLIAAIAGAFLFLIGPMVNRLGHGVE